MNRNRTLISLLSAMLLALAFVVPQTATAQTVLQAGFGDVNADGIVNVSDVTTLVNIVLGKSPFSLMTADLNADGNVDAMDVTTLVSFILENGTTTPTTGNVSVNVLALGNSYCNDAYSYVPYVMHNVAPEVELTIAFLSVGGCYLERHYKEFCLQNKPYLYYYRHGPADVSWIKRDSVRLSEVLGERDWDIILFQQASGFSDDYSTYQPYVTQLLEWFDERLAKPHTYGWLMTPAYPDGLDRLGDKSSEQMYGEIADCARRVMEDTDIGFLIPAGTAIQNARHTSLDALGAFGHLSADGVHYHDGIPRLIESYAVVQTLLEHLGLERDINNDMLAITKQWLIEMNIERSWNAPTEVTEANRTLAKKCVNAAMREPFRVTVVAE